MGFDEECLGQSIVPVQEVDCDRGGSRSNHCGHASVRFRPKAATDAAMRQLKGPALVFPTSYFLFQFESVPLPPRYAPQHLLHVSIQAREADCRFIRSVGVGAAAVDHEGDAGRECGEIALDDAAVGQVDGKGFAPVGTKDNKAFVVLEGRPRGVLFTPNSDTPYAAMPLDLKVGPITVELPEGPLIGVANDLNFRWVIDMGLPGPDAGNGGKHVILPPEYKGKVPDGYYTGTSSTNRVSSSSARFRSRAM